MEEAVVVSGARTVFGKFGGSLKDIPTVDLGAMVIQEVLQRAAVEPSRADQVIMGQVLPTAGMTATRQAVLRAELALGTISLTLDRACCSAMTAIALARDQIRLGEAAVAIAGGMENMSATPYLLHKARWGARLGDFAVEDLLELRNPYLKQPRVVYAGNTALEYGEGREEQDRWAVQSHLRYGRAFEAGLFRDEILPVKVPAAKGGVALVERDEQYRADSSLEKLAKLSTVYGSPTVTPGNAPGLNDGAAAVLLMGQSRARAEGREVLGTLLSYAPVSGEPSHSVRLPAEAIRKALAKIGLSVDDLALVEINEAYAAMPLVSTRVLADGDAVRLERLRERTNVNGGAVAIGHPIGASGARVLMTLIFELRRRGGGIGAAAICGGIGQADAMIVRV